MPLSESDTRAKLIDPALHRRGWTEDLIKREETAGAIEVMPEGRPRRRARGRIDYTLRVKVNIDTRGRLPNLAWRPWRSAPNVTKRVVLGEGSIRSARTGPGLPSQG